MIVAILASKRRYQTCAGNHAQDSAINIAIKIEKKDKPSTYPFLLQTIF